MSNFESKAFRLVLWSAVERLVPQIVLAIVYIFLARILLPEQFGFVSMLYMFIAIGEVLIESGFGLALIQKKDVTELHYSSVFYANIILGLIASITLSLVAPQIARFYGKPILISLTRALSLVFLINAFGLIHIYLMTKRLDFKTQTKVSLIASIGAGIIGITMALLGLGVWSLVSLILSSALFHTILLWLYNNWHPQPIFSIAALRELFSFGSRVLASRLLDTIFKNLYYVVIGKLFSPADLGFYTRANSFQKLPSETLGWIVSRVTLPVFSEIQDDLIKVEVGFHKALQALSFINFPIMIGILVSAQQLVLTILTDKWAPAIPYLQLLCILGLLLPLEMLNINIPLARGRSEIFFRLEIIKKVLIIIFLAMTWQMGIKSIIWGQIGTSIITYYLSSYYNRQLLGYGFRKQFIIFSPYLLAAVIMGICVHSISLLQMPNPTVFLVIQIITGVISYTLVCRILCLPIFMEGWRNVHDRLKAIQVTLFS